MDDGKRRAPRAFLFFRPSFPTTPRDLCGASEGERDAHQLSSDPIMHNSGLRGCKGVILVAGVPSLLLPYPPPFSLPPYYVGYHPPVTGKGFNHSEYDLTSFLKALVAGPTGVRHSPPAQHTGNLQTELNGRR